MLLESSMQRVLDLDRASQDVYNRLQLDYSTNVTKYPYKLLADKNALGLSPLPDEQA